MNMNKTRKLFCAAILLLSVACKDAPMTEPCSINKLEFVENGKDRTIKVGFDNLLPTLEIALDFDSCSYFLNGAVKDTLVSRNSDDFKFVLAAISSNKLYLRTQGVDIEMFSSPQVFFNIRANQGYIVRNEKTGKLGYSILRSGEKVKLLSEDFEIVLELEEPNSGKSWVIGSNTNQKMSIVALD